jgi:DNA-3-methyladenine glycosylase
MILPKRFFARKTVTVAKDLLGKYLVRDVHGKMIAGRIVETEAYIGPHDLACHASKGRTARTDVLYGRPGTAYVYLIYGMYWCFNVVTEREDYPAAVLIRAIESDDGTLIDGPGRTCRALGIDKQLNRWDLTAGERLWMEDRGGRIRRSHYAALPRIGVDYAEQWATKPLRFRLVQHTVVKKRRLDEPRRR